MENQAEKPEQKIVDGLKVRVVAGDRDTVLFDPFGTVRNIKDGRCEIHLKACYFRSSVSEIGVGKDIIPYDWKEGEDAMDSLKPKLRG